MKRVNLIIWGLLLFYAAVMQGQQTMVDIENAYKSYNETLPQEKIYLHIDRPMYEPGEDIWFSGYVRNAVNLRSTLSRTLYVELINPRGAVEQQLNLAAQQGSFKGDFKLKENVPGGRYKIRAYTNWSKNFGEETYFEKEIVVQAVVLPKLLMTLDFEKEAYGAGDRVGVAFEVRTPDDEPLKYQLITYKVNLGGKNYETGTVKTDNRGKATVFITLPDNLKTMDGLLNIKVPYQGSTESISRAIPIVLNDIDIQFFPEGGDLVAGMKNKVAFKALNTFGKAADISGYVYDDAGNTITTFESYHQGMGYFEVPATIGATYKVKITKPVGLVEDFQLPKVMDQTLAVQVKKQTFQQLNLNIFANEAQPVYVALRMGGEIQWMKEIATKTGDNDLTLQTAELPTGIAQITVFDAQKRPHTERLVFLNKHRTLTVEVKTDKKKYLPREQIMLKIRAMDSEEKPVVGDFSIAVVEDKLYTFADDKQDNILSGLLMSSELKGKVEEPNFYFDPKEEKATTALDLVLLTNGWRRYDWKQILRGDLKTWVNVRKYKPDEGRISGKVIMDGIPLKNVKVSTVNKGLVARTDKNGEFEMIGNINLPTHLQVNYRGFKHKIYIQKYSQPKEPKNEGKRPLDKSVDVQELKKEGTEVEEIEEAEADDEVAAVAEEPMDFNRFGGEELDEVVVVAAQAKRAVSAVKANAVSVQAEHLAAVSTGYSISSQDASYTFLFDGDFESHHIYIQQTAKEQPYYGRQFYMPKYYSLSTNERTDFRKTILWNARLTTNSQGEASVSCYASDEVTTFRAIVEGISDKGIIGRTEQTIYTQLPFGLDVKLPKVVTQGDVVTIPVVIRNNTENVLSGNIVPKVPAGFLPTAYFPTSVQVEPGAFKNMNFTYSVSSSAKVVRCGFGFYDYQQKQQDFISQAIDVKATGFPMTLSASGVEKERKLNFRLNKPIAGTLKAQFKAYGSVLDEILSGVASMLRSPGGCFEQTSSSNYPNIMALKYLQQQNIIDKALQTRANQYLETGYNRLAGYECDGGGFEWFGNNPAHEALTAYGLLQFKDMKEVFDGVDDAMVQRAADWLMSRRDGQGGWQKGQKGYHRWVFGMAREAYIVYALSEVGEQRIGREIDKVTQHALATKDWYIMALAAMANYNIGNEKIGNEVLDQLLNVVRKGDLNQPQVEMTVTQSGGISLRNETLALVALATMKGKRTSAQPILNDIIQKVSSERSYGGFGSTQATVLVLKAIVAYTEFSARPKEAGGFDVYVNNQKIHTALYEKDHIGAIEVDFAGYLREGINAVSVQYFDTENPIPYSFDISWNTTTPNSQKDCVVGVTTKLSDKSTKVGETVRLSATVKNLSTKNVPTPIAIIGIPSGLSVQPWQMKELKEKGAFDFYEIQDNYLVIYYTGLEASAQKVLNLDLKADIAGRYKAPASSAYLYYTSELKNWTDGTEILIE